jgi:hypothetical protein
VLGPPDTVLASTGLRLRILSSETDTTTPGSATSLRPRPPPPRPLLVRRPTHPDTVLRMHLQRGIRHRLGIIRRRTPGGAAPAAVEGHCTPPDDGRARRGPGAARPASATTAGSWADSAEDTGYRCAETCHSHAAEGGACPVPAGLEGDGRRRDGRVLAWLERGG